ncbi:MAG: integration host factor subunit beta [Tannerella sp.]|jgi:DNA-binding protein HU-beta|nr:integration host factor subunit beta [Tannerella sp.]
MTKAELISLISKSTGIEKSEVLNIVTSFMDTIKKSLDEGENVYLRGFGSFIVKKRAEKKARNISRNTTITIPEHNIPAFKPAKVFMEAIASDKKKSKKKK